MAYSFSKKLDFNVKKSDIEFIITQTIEQIGWKYKKLTDNYYKASIGWNMKSYGENIFITAESNNSLFVESKLTIFHVIDYGRNKKNVLTFEDVLQTVIHKHYGSNHALFLEEEPKAILNANSFVSRIIKLNTLFEAEILSKEEFQSKKSEVIGLLKSSKQSVNNEELLIALIELKQNNILSNEDIVLIKKTIN